LQSQSKYRDSSFRRLQIMRIPHKSGKLASNCYPFKVCLFCLLFSRFKSILCIYEKLNILLHLSQETQQWMIYRTFNIFLAHLSWKLKWAIPIARRPSVHPSVCLSVNFYIFDFFSRTTGPILTRLGTNHPWGKGFKFVQTKGIALLQGEIIAKE
jgi:hypothetical protein